MLRGQKFFLAIMFSDEYALEKTREEFFPAVGEADLELEPYAFEIDYYKREMGEHIRKFLVSFLQLREPEFLVELKLASLEEELRRSVRGKRRVNIDPGYITLNSVILASRKSAAHRIYLSKGVFADLHLIFHSGKFNPLPWTYPDYKRCDVLEFFRRMRDIYKISLRKQF